MIWRANIYLTHIAICGMLAIAGLVAAGLMYSHIIDAVVLWGNAGTSQVLSAFRKVGIGPPLQAKSNLVLFSEDIAVIDLPAYHDIEASVPRWASPDNGLGRSIRAKQWNGNGSISVPMDKVWFFARDHDPKKLDFGPALQISRGGFASVLNVHNSVGAGVRAFGFYDRSPGFYLQPCPLVEPHLFFVKMQRIVCNFSRLFSRFIEGNINEQQPNIDEQQASGAPGNDDFNPFFPSWGIVLAPVGWVVLGWGWWHIREDRRIHLLAFIGGCLLWMYGLGCIITRLSG